MPPPYFIFFIRSYRSAKQKNEDTFEYQGQTFLTAYAGHLIYYLEQSGVQPHTQIEFTNKPEEFQEAV